MITHTQTVSLRVEILYTDKERNVKPLLQFRQQFDVGADRAHLPVAEPDGQGQQEQHQAETQAQAGGGQF